MYVLVTGHTTPSTHLVPEVEGPAEDSVVRGQERDGAVEESVEDPGADD